MAEKTNIGKVLWFDHKKGWGFIRVINPDSEYLDKEVFVHYSTIECNSSFRRKGRGSTMLDAF